MAGALVRMATQAGKKNRFRRMLEDGAVRAAGGAGRAVRYGRDNAMPLVLGASIGGGAATAYQQTRDRRMSKGLASALRPKTRGGKLVPAMRNPAVRARVDANIQGRAAGSYMATGTAYGAGRAPGNVMMGRNARANSRSVFRRTEA